MRLFIFCLGMLMLMLPAGCAVAPANAPRFTPAPSAPKGYATVYIYRLGAPPYSRDIKLSIAGKPIFDAPEQAYTWMFVRAGTHALFAEWPSDFLGPKRHPDVTAVQVFEPGESYYFRVSGNIRLASGGLFSSGVTVFTSYLDRRPSDDGNADLVACCRYMPPVTEKLE